MFNTFPGIRYLLILYYVCMYLDIIRFWIFQFLNFLITSLEERAIVLFYHPSYRDMPLSLSFAKYENDKKEGVYPSEKSLNKKFYSS